MTQHAGGTKRTKRRQRGAISIHIPAHSEPSDRPAVGIKLAEGLEVQHLTISDKSVALSNPHAVANQLGFIHKDVF